MGCFLSNTGTESDGYDQVATVSTPPVDEEIEMKYDKLQIEYENKCKEYDILERKCDLYNENNLLQNESNVVEKYSSLKSDYDEVLTQFEELKSMDATRSHKLEKIYQKEYEKLLQEFTEYKQTQTQTDNDKGNKIEELEMQELKKNNEFLKKNQSQMQEIYEGEYEKLLNEFQEYKQQFPANQT